MLQTLNSQQTSLLYSMGPLHQPIITKLIQKAAEYFSIPALFWQDPALLRFPKKCHNWTIWYNNEKTAILATHIDYWPYFGQSISWLKIGHYLLKYPFLSVQCLVSQAAVLSLQIGTCCSLANSTPTRFRFRIKFQELLFLVPIELKFGSLFLSSQVSCKFL